MKTCWDEIVDSDYADTANKIDTNFQTAVDKMVMKFLNCDQPRDVMLTNMAPNGGLIKDPFGTAQTHSLRWKTMLRVSKQLPKSDGDIELPSEKLQLT